MVQKLDDIIWGGSGIERAVFDFIRERIPDGSTIVELGSGLVSTRALSLFYDLYSIDHDERYINLFDGVKYIHAPLVDGWYDRRIVVSELPDQYSLVLVDGKNRELILNNMDLFDPEALFIVHDTYRDEEMRTANGISKEVGRKVEFHTNGDYWASI